MRLIDADELKKNSFRDCWNIAIVTVEDIDNAPTINKCDNCDLMLIAKTKGEKL